METLILIKSLFGDTYFLKDVKGNTLASFNGEKFARTEVAKFARENGYKVRIEGKKIEWL